ncbi:MAG TPA: c-type cytochrome [Steroidobacteraceae bacterium]|nr:c-type cytochrome [Steroidobacteraceae bacterium]
MSLSLPSYAAGDAKLGQKKFYTCYGCHGIENYRNAYPAYEVPKLRHQHAAYIIAALQEYKAGERPYPTMHAQASSLSAQDIEDIAAYLQGPEPVQPNPTIVGKMPPQAQTCAACHGANGLGVAAPLLPKPPILAGQHEDYLVQALTQYRDGRRNNPIMMGMAKSLASAADVRIVAAYFASQPSPLATATIDSK